MIADVVNAAIMGIGFGHAAGRLIFYRGIRGGTTEEWVEPLSEHQERNISDSTKNL
jgi:hypothetical protein